MSPAITSPKLGYVLATLTLFMILASSFSVGTAAAQTAAPTTLTAYKSTIAVNVHSVYTPSQWTDTPLIHEPVSGISFALKQNGTGLLFLMTWNQTSNVCSDQYCYGGLELASQNNTAVMGSS